jgi:hypothetical protein
MKWIIVVAALAVAAGDGPSRADDPPPAVVARVGDAPVLQSAFDAVIRRLGPQQTITADRRRRVEAAVMEQLVDEVLIRSELEHRQIAVADSEIDTALGQFKAQFNGDASYQAFLAATGRDEAGLRDQLRLNIGMEKYARPLMTPPALDAVFQAQRREVDGTRLRALTGAPAETLLHDAVDAALAELGFFASGAPTRETGPSATVAAGRRATRPLLRSRAG